MTEDGDAATQGSESGEGGGSGLGRVLEDLRSLSGEVEAGYVVSGEGGILASTVEGGGERAGAMISALSSASTRRARERGHEAYSQVRVRAEEGYVLLTRLSDGSTLAATTGPEARVGLVLYDMRNARPEAERVLSGTSGGDDA
ncbi:roadblock/LC7 domain-containing protein [Rubrobacter aplysinae]|uniref:roadblock/LC7 domain-containing protein n=1 Tax=Rubrobacter aplysinae TaxID=909625 RepID=UPI00064B9459|nr:roadblock/LC7 domain-containing protein [Rubrobacter aplysinae]